MTWGERILDIVWTVGTIAFMWGPALRLWYLHARSRELKVGELTGTLAWTSIVLLFVWFHKIEIASDHRVACRLLEMELSKGVEDGDEVEMPFECYRYTEEYADLAAEMNEN